MCWRRLLLLPRQARTPVRISRDFRCGTEVEGAGVEGREEEAHGLVVPSARCHVQRAAAAAAAAAARAGPRCCHPWGFASHPAGRHCGRGRDARTCCLPAAPLEHRPRSIV
eukprot:COSAG01_NODE_5647_length_4118_cov_6.676288_1_plen_111_part_00